jgi:4-amino-4-deoxy-L-arabinose transferase-like glycosyltransferase
MWAALLLATPLGLYFSLRHSWHDDRRVQALMALVASGCVLTAITEFLSLGRALSFGPLLAAWTFAALVCAAIAAWTWRRRAPAVPTARQQALGGLSPYDIGLLACLLLIVVPTGLIAMTAEPNNWDSMTYHLSRVMHWIQDRSVAMYPTHCLRQLHQNPWAESAILNLMVLGGDDRLANLVQWLSMIGSLVGVSLLARQFGSGSHAQVLAAVVCATIPMGILQSTSTQTDYVLSFWLVCFALFALRFNDTAHAPRMAAALAMGGALGLAILTKATAYLFAFPFLMWVAFAVLRARDVRRAWYLVLAMLLTLAVNIGHYARSYELFGNPLGPGRESPEMVFANETFSVASLASNVLRNVAVNLSTPSDRANRRIEQTVLGAHRALGIAPDDPRTTWFGTKFRIRPILFHEDLDGSGLHVLLILAVIVLFAIRPRGPPDAAKYGLCLIAGFLLFCAIAKWQPWISRLQLPLFVLWSPLIGIFFARACARWFTTLAAVLLVAAAFPWVVGNLTRPLVGPVRVTATSAIDQLFINRPDMKAPYIGAAHALAAMDCHEVGIDLGGDDWEYPLWTLLERQGAQAIRIEHVNVPNVSARLQGPDQPGGPFRPCALFRVADDPPALFTLGEDSFSRTWMSGKVAVYALRPVPG